MLKIACQCAVAVAVIALLCCPVEAVVTIFSDDFESYPNTAALIAPGAWGDNNAANIALSTTLSASGNPGQALMSQRANNADALISAQHNIAPITPTDAQPIIWSLDFFDDGVGNKRVTGGLRNTSVSALLEMGRFNSVANVEDNNTLVSGYAVRAVNVGGTPAGNSGWVTFVGNPSVQSGWHNFTATISGSHVLFELDFGADGVVDANRVVNTSTGGSEIYNVLRLGGPSDVSSAGGGARFDNVLLGLFEPTPGPFNTGVGDHEMALLGDAVDPHWTVHRVASDTAPVNLTAGAPTFVVPQDGFPIPPWVPNDSNSAWISSTQDNDASDAQGFYDYTLFFDVLDAEAPGFMVEGQWAVDNEGIEIFINGDPTGNMNTAGFASFTDFSIDSGFIGGLNTLTFRVENAPSSNNPTGLHVEFSRFGAIPEPASAVLVVVGVAGLAMRRRRHA